MSLHHGGDPIHGFGHYRDKGYPHPYLRVLKNQDLWITATLEMFHWIEEEVADQPTHISEMEPLTPTIEGNRNMSGNICKVLWLPGPHNIPCVLQEQTIAAPLYL